MNAQISLFFCKSTRWFLKFCGLSCCWNEKRKRKCKKVIPTTTKTSRKKGEEPHFLCQQNYLQLTLKLSKWKVTTTRTVTFHRHSECPISYLPYFRKQFPRKLFFVESAETSQGRKLFAEIRYIKYMVTYITLPV